MARCDLSIEVEGGRVRFQPGETVRGRVHVSVNKDCRCDGLLLHAFWRTHGRGNRARGVPITKALFTGDWRAGQTASYDFELELPVGPMTYRGQYLNVDWYLKAEADIPWAFDPKAELDLLMEGEPIDASLATMSFYSGLADPASVKPVSKAVVYAIVGCFGLFMFVGLGGGLIAAISTGEVGAIIPVGLIFSIFALIVGVVVVRRLMTRARLGDVTLEVSPRTSHPGGALDIRLAFLPRGSGDVNKIEAKLVAKEVVVSGSGTNRHTHTRKVAEYPLLLSEATRLVPGQAVDLTGQLVVPADAPYSFRARDNNLRWSVEAVIDIAAWPDWSGNQTVLVLPAWVPPRLTADTVGLGGNPHAVPPQPDSHTMTIGD